MNVYLLYPDRDFDLQQEPPPNADALLQDLELPTLFTVMANGDPFLFEVAKRAILLRVTDLEVIGFRQQVLSDCLAQPALVREIYALAVEAVTSERQVRFGWFGDSPNTVLYRSVQVLEILFGVLTRLRRLTDERAATFHSPGFRRLFAMLAEELNDDYLRTVEHHLTELKFKRGVLLSARLGKGLKGTGYVVRPQREQGWLERFGLQGRSGYSFTIPDRDEAGAKALNDLRGRGINLVAHALAQATDHIISFFAQLQTELAFYLGCLNLRERLAAKGEQVCLPSPMAAEAVALSARGLYDVCLSLLVEARVVGNDVDADGKTLVMVTGANQGGKSTFLRSVGLAQLMLQAGMFVPAEFFQASVCSGIFTHYTREEDASLRSGKLDEELRRMSEIADQIEPSGLLLCNESFAATNEREGSEIARQVILALTAAGVRILFVTHLYDLAHRLYQQHSPGTLFLRAERSPDGRRTYRITPGEPLPTSFGADTYREIFGNGDALAAYPASATQVRN